MSLWMILPVSLPVLTFTGIWVVYAMALYNQHVCPVDNWLYNQSCEEELHLQRGPTLCCTLDNVPLISKCGALPPESCFFSLICSTGSFMVMVIVLFRYAHVIEKHQNCVLNTAGLSTGWICAAGLIMVGNFQVDNAKVLHYVGAGIAFPTSMLFVCLQSALTYRLAKTQGEYGVAHLRLCMTLLAFAALVLSILPSRRQMAACEPVKCITTQERDAASPGWQAGPLSFQGQRLAFLARDRRHTTIDRGDIFKKKEEILTKLVH